MARTKGRGARIRTSSPTPSPPPCNPPSSPKNTNTVEKSPDTTQKELNQSIVDDSPISTQNPSPTQNPQTEPEDVEPISIVFPSSTNPDSSENDPSEPEIEIQLTQNQPIHSEGMVTPIHTMAVPSQAETPPVLVKAKKSQSKSQTKSYDSAKIRRSARILSGIGTGRKIVKDTTVHVIDDDEDDSENTLSDHHENVIADNEPESVTSSKSLPPKPKSKPSPAPIKKSQSASKTPKPKAKTMSVNKGSKTKISEIPLIHPADEERFETFWKVKPVAAGRTYEFDDLAKGGVDLLKYTEPLGWTSFFKINESIFPLLVQAFYFNAKVDMAKSEITTYIKGVEIQLDPKLIGDILGLKAEGVEAYGENWYTGSGVSRDALILQMFNEQGAQREKPPSSMLKKEYKLLHNFCQHCIFPRTGSLDKVTDNDLLIMHHLSKGTKLNLPYIIIQHMIHVANSGIKKVTLPYAMILTKIFRIFKVDEKDQRVENSCTSFKFKNIHHMKKDLVSEDSFDLGKRKRDEFEKEGLNILADALGDQPENNLQAGNSAGTNIGVTSDSIPSHISTSLHFGTPFSHGFRASVPPRAGKELQGFLSTTSPYNTTLFSPLMTSSQGSLDTFKSSEFFKNFDDIPNFPQFTQPIFASGSLPSLPTAFGTLDSFCSSANTAAATNAINTHVGFEPNVKLAGEGTSDQRPFKRTKMEKDVSKTKKNVERILDGMTIQNNMLMHLMIEHQTLRNWLIANVCPAMNIPPPPLNPPPHIPEFPPPHDDATSSDDSSPTVPK
ncbi:hypothetical protein QL285_032838 [Trifolium repens]|nr:hypothetical protein QL285_032838 [Trifolium repens]